MEKVKIIGTGKSKEMPEGKAFYEPEDMAKHLVETGFATYEGQQKKKNATSTK